MRNRRFMKHAVAAVGAALAARQPTAAARQSAMIFIVTGTLVPGVTVLLTPRAPGNRELVIIGSIGAVVGVVLGLLPWHRWHRRWILVSVPAAFTLIAAANVAQFTPLEYGVYYSVIFIWIGLTQGRWVCVAFSPVAVTTYVAALRIVNPDLGWDASLASALTVIPISVLVSEIVAAKVAAMTTAQRESEHRAELLRAVSKACRVISTLDRAAVLTAVADALGEMGYGVSSFSFFIADAERYQVDEARGLPEEYHQNTHETDGTLTGRVRDLRATVVLDNYTDADVAHPTLAGTVIRSTIATPISVAGELVGVLVAGSARQLRVTPQDVEAVELLAAQAGRALENARTFEAEVEVSHQRAEDSRRDVLTGIGNRRHAMTLLDSLRPGDALALIDLDHFKAVNDTYGHAAGDAVLTELGAFLADAVRDSDDVARYGGEEFLLVLRNAADGAGVVLSRLTDAWRVQSARTTFSTGYAVHRRGVPAETLGNADSALYSAKRAGRDRVHAYVPSPRTAAARR